MIDTIIELKSRCSFIEEIGAAYGLRAGEVNCIMQIANGDSPSLKELSSLLGLSASRTSRLVNRLREKSYVRIVGDQQDRRFVGILLTEEGRRCNDFLLKEKKTCERRLESQLTEQERQTIRQGLSLLLRVM